MSIKHLPRHFAWTHAHVNFADSAARLCLVLVCMCHSQAPRLCHGPCSDVEVFRHPEMQSSPRQSYAKISCRHRSDCRQGNAMSLY